MKHFNIKKNRKLQLMLVDFTILLLTNFAAYFVSNSFLFVDFSARSIIPELVLFIVLNMLCLLSLKVYTNIWKYARINEFADCIAAVSLGAGLCFLILKLTGKNVSGIY